MTVLDKVYCTHIRVDLIDKAIFHYKLGKIGKPSQSCAQKLCFFFTFYSSVSVGPSLKKLR